MKKSQNIKNYILFLFYSIDATEETPYLGRLINHSSNGNLKPKCYNVDGNPRLGFIALKKISIGEELSYDYGERRKEYLDANPWLKKNQGKHWQTNFKKYFLYVRRL